MNFDDRYTNSRKSGRKDKHGSIYPRWETVSEIAETVEDCAADADGGIHPGGDPARDPDQ